jgi:hypothetical protein
MFDGGKMEKVRSQREDGWAQNTLEVKAKVVQTACHHTLTEYLKPGSSHCQSAPRSTQKHSKALWPVFPMA